MLSKTYCNQAITNFKKNSEIKDKKYYKERTVEL